MSLKRLLWISIFTGFMQNAYADIQVTSVSDGDSKSVIKISNTWAKVSDLSDPAQYMLIDMKKNLVYIVDNNNRMVITMESISDMMPGHGESHHPKDGPKIEVVKTGDGPKIAGFKTAIYQLKADGKVCSEHYISNDLLKHSEIKAFSDSMRKQTPPDMGMDESMAPCELAEIRFDRLAFDYGAPLLSKDTNGNTLFETTEIKVDIKLGADEFALPKGFPVISQKELMQQMMQNGMPGNGGEEAQ